MAGVLANPWTQIALVPLILMIIGVFARRLGRQDGDPTPRKNDWAVGTTLLLMALGTILGDISNEHDAALSSLPYWLIGVLLAAFISLNHDRYNSWARDAQGLPTREKLLYSGIIFLDVLCFIVFAAYQAHKVKML
jgi:hypothetical protein